MSTTSSRRRRRRRRRRKSSRRRKSRINSRSMNVSKELSFLSSSISSKKRLRAEEDDFADLIRISSSTEISDQGIFKIQLLISYTNFNNKININHLLLLLLILLLYS